MLRKHAHRSPAIPLTLILTGVALTGFLVASGCSSPDDSPSKALANYQPPVPPSANQPGTTIQGQSAPSISTDGSDGFAGLAPQGTSGSFEGTIWESSCLKAKRSSGRQRQSYRHTRVQFDQGRLKLTHSAWLEDPTCANENQRMMTLELIGIAALNFVDQGLTDASGAIRAHLEVTQHELFLSFDRPDLVNQANEDAVCGISSWAYRTFLSIDSRTCRPDGMRGPAVGVDFVSAFIYLQDQVYPHGTVYTSREVVWPSPTQTTDAKTGQINQHEQLQISPLVVNSLKARQMGRMGVSQKAISGQLTVYRTTWVQGTGRVQGAADDDQQGVRVINPDNDPFKKTR